jgi:hypothetical protein
LDRQLIELLSETKNCESLPIRAFAPQEIPHGFERGRQLRKDLPAIREAMESQRQRDG